jgi:hypothetical protein
MTYERFEIALGQQLDNQALLNKAARAVHAATPSHSLKRQNIPARFATKLGQAGVSSIVQA